MENATAVIEILIEAPVAKVWDNLTKPELIKKYFFDTSVETDWKPGRPIYFRGNWKGTEYVDKGRILEFIPLKRISFTYWSSLSAKPGLPENYQVITYNLESKGNVAMVAVSQECLESEKGQCESNWRTVVAGLKKQVE